MRSLGRGGGVASLYRQLGAGKWTDGGYSGYVIGTEQEYLVGYQNSAALKHSPLLGL